MISPTGPDGVTDTPLPPPMPTGVSRRTQLLFFLVGAIAVTVLIARADPMQLLHDVRQAGWAVPAVVAVYGGVYLLNTIAWRLTMTDEPRISFWRAYAITVSAFAINYMTPFVSIGGEPFKIVAASQWLGPSRGVASVLNFRLVHMQAHGLVFLTVVLLAFFLLPKGVIGTAALGTVALVLILLTGFLLLLHREGMVERALDFTLKLPLIRRAARKLEHRRDQLIEIDHQLITFHRKSPAQYWGSLAAEYGARVISMLEFWVIARAMGTPVNFATAFLIGGFSSLIVNMFFFMPFNVGSKEGGLYAIFGLLGLPARLGIAAGVLSRLRELSWIGIGFLLILATRRSNASRQATL